MDTLLAHIDEDILTRYDLTNSTKELVSKTQRNFTAAKQALDQVGK